MYTIVVLCVLGALSFASQACFTGLPQEVQHYSLMFILDKDTIIKSLRELYALRVVNKRFYSCCNKTHLMRDPVIKTLASHVGITPRAVALHISNICKLNTLEKQVLLSKYQANKDLDALLIQAVKEGNREQVQDLLLKNADVDARDTYSKTALIYATLGSHKDIVTLLLNWSANVDAATSSGKTALMYAVEASNNDIIAMLINLGAAINAKSRCGRTAFIYAACRSDKDIATMLLDAGADTHAQDRLKAPQDGHKTVEQLLLSIIASKSSEYKRTRVCLIQ